MTENIQQVISLLFVTLAAVFLMVRVYRKATGQSGEGCDGCGGNCGKPHRVRVRQAPQARPLHRLERRGRR